MEFLLMRLPTKPFPIQIFLGLFGLYNFCTCSKFSLWSDGFCTVKFLFVEIFCCFGRRTKKKSMNEKSSKKEEKQEEEKIKMLGWKIAYLAEEKDKGEFMAQGATTVSHGSESSWHDVFWHFSLPSLDRTSLAKHPINFTLTSHPISFTISLLCDFKPG